MRYLYQSAYICILSDVDHPNINEANPFIVLQKQTFNFYTKITIIRFNMNTNDIVKYKINDVSILKILKILKIKLLKKLTDDEIYYLLYQINPVEFKFLIKFANKPSYIIKKSRLTKLNKLL